MCQYRRRAGDRTADRLFQLPGGSCQGSQSMSVARCLPLGIAHLVAHLARDLDCLGRHKVEFGWNKKEFGRNKKEFGRNRKEFERNKTAFGRNKDFGRNKMDFGRNKVDFGRDKMGLRWDKTESGSSYEDGGYERSSPNTRKRWR